MVGVATFYEVLNVLPLGKVVHLIPPRSELRTTTTIIVESITVEGAGISAVFYCLRAPTAWPVDDDDVIVK